MVSTAWWCVLLVCAVCGAHGSADSIDSVQGLSDNDSLVADLGEAEMGMETNKEGVLQFLGQPEMTLGEIQAIADGSQVMDTSRLRHFRDRFVKLAEKLKSNSLKSSTLMMAQMSVGEMTSTKKRAGMSLIFEKLAELEKKVAMEGKDDTTYIENERDKCNTNVQTASTIITTAGAKKGKNDFQIREDHAVIQSSREEHKSSRSTEGNVQSEFNDMQEERTDVKAGFAQRIDERNKAIDVMIKATFIVCGKFRKFKDTDQCKSIKSRPDVDEPGVKVFPPSPSQNLPPAWRNESDIQADKEATKAYESSQADAWAAREETDEALEGNPNPENLPMHNGGVRGPAKKEMSNTEVELAEDDEVPVPVTAEDQPGLADLKALATHASREQLDSRYALPITELALAVGAGKTRKTKSIVQILLDVRDITIDEQKKDKEDLVAQLDSFYARAWDMRGSMNAETSKQAELLNGMDAAHGRMQMMLQDTEEQLQAMKTQLTVRTLEEDRCARENEEFAIRDAVRVEDLENLVKLTSLLRSLYDKKEPKACAKVLGVMCTNQQNGWCVFTDKESNEQRCSCNYGYYGSNCEKTMCPGDGQDLFMAKNAEGQRNAGACSSQGICDGDTGLCSKCDDGFYHGEKEACEKKHCPASKGNIVDEKCSGHGTCDLKRGTCACAEGFSGPGCENQSCPNSNGVVYPFDSANACNGRGACSVETGGCACAQPYYGDSCEKSKCPEDCLGIGGCNAETGKCACPGGTSGASCEFKDCPQDCNAPGNGNCNRLEGLCVCKMGFIGEACQVSTRCSAAAHSVKEQNWYTTWDKPGWITCPAGQLIWGLRRSLCNSLACLEAGRCAAPCEGAGDEGKPLEIRHCYHSLDWYGSMDTEGWSKCDPNYAVAGLYRSCDSLYCIQMAKCCSYKDTRWAQCQEVNWFAPFDAAGWVKVPDHQFISGLYRGAGQQLKDIDKAWSCGLVQGY